MVSIEVNNTNFDFKIDYSRKFSQIFQVHLKPLQKENLKRDWLLVPIYFYIVPRPYLLKKSLMENFIFRAVILYNIS